ncbi:MAG: 2Fe-2S iron-sulfur cluster-binding protein [Bradyrhizobium sp.]
MPRIEFISHAGKNTVLDIPKGQSVMHAATSNGIEPIVGECGGSCMCATCHVYLPEDRLALMPPMTPSEDEMLQATAEPRRPNSRLGCQLIVTEEMNGLVVYLPEREI